MIASAVGKDGAIPSSEPMQATRLFYNLQSWPEVKVIGVSQNYFCFNIIPQFALVNGFHRTGRGHWHKDWSRDFTVIGVDCSAASTRVRVGRNKFKFHETAKLW